jgi:hypothetical protein
MADSLTARIFAHLYPEYELITVGHTYIVYPPPGLGKPLMYISGSLGAVARLIVEAENLDLELADLIADETDPLPRRNP